VWAVSTCQRTGRGTDKFAYKLAWLARWRGWLAAHAEASQPLVLCGDINIAPRIGMFTIPKPGATSDVSPDERAALAEVRRWAWSTCSVSFILSQASTPGGTTAAQLPQEPRPAHRPHPVHRDDGRALPVVVIDREARKGETPSDHAPVVAEFAEM